MKNKDIFKNKKDEKIIDAKIDIDDSDIRKNILSIGLPVLCLSVLVVISMFLLFGDAKDNINNHLADSIKFKQEYEKLNNQDNSYGSSYLEINISKNNLIHYSSYSEVFELLENGSGVIYFGFPECPWCRNLVPVLLDASIEAGIDNIYYLNNKEDRDIKKLDDDGNIIVEKEGTDNYFKLVEKLESVLESYEGVDEDVKRLYYPTVIFVKDGKIVDSHIGTLDSQTNPMVHLTDEQHKELKDILVEKMQKTFICDSAC